MPPLFIGKNTIELPSVNSTNSYAKALVQSEKPVEGILVFAHEQLHGRGQRDNQWESEKGKNITMSIVLYPNFLEASRQFLLSMAIALGVKDFCESILQDEIKVKWPNDIYYRNMKIGGILIENTVSNTSITSSIIGIGLNINQMKFPASVANPTSFSLITGNKYELKPLMEGLSSYLEKYYLQLRQQHFNFLEKAYTEALYRYQQTFEFKKGQQIFKGEINGITKDGKLIIHCGGKEQRFAFKEVEYMI